MENERKHVDVKLVTKWLGKYGAKDPIAKPNFHRRSIFAENLVVIQLSRTEIVIKKPIYVGLAVLDLSEVLLYDFHYTYMKRTFSICRLLYCDTDSLTYRIFILNVYEIMKRHIARFDTSDYAIDNQFGMPLANKKVLGLMKDTCCRSIMLEFIGLRSKMYSMKIQGRDTIMKIKGVKTNVVQETIFFADYKDCFMNENVIKREQCNIVSKSHIVTTERQQKVALSPHDDKRCLIPGETNTLPWGHHRGHPYEEAVVAARAWNVGGGDATAQAFPSTWMT